MHKVSSPCVCGVDSEDVMEGSWVCSLDVIETLIESDDDEVDPLMIHEEEVDSPLNGREESSSSIKIYSKESSNFTGVEDMKTGLGSIPLLKSLERWSRKLKK